MQLRFRLGALKPSTMPLRFSLGRPKNNHQQPSKVSTAPRSGLLSAAAKTNSSAAIRTVISSCQDHQLRRQDCNQ